MSSIKLPPQLTVDCFRYIKLGSSGAKLKVPIEIGWNIHDLVELEQYIKNRQIKWDEAEANGTHEELRANGKYVPKRPVFRDRLNNYAHSEPEFQDWLKRGNNYGVTSAGGLIKLESDDIQRWQDLGVLELLPETFTVQSSSKNRLHFYYIGPEVADSPLRDPETNEDIGHIRGTGEAGGRGGMVVGPGSLHPHNVRYQVREDRPIATISKEILDKVKSILCGKSASGNETKNQKKTDHKDPFVDVTISQVLGPYYKDFHMEGSQMAGPNPYGQHTNQNGRCLVIEPGDKEFYCFECEQGGGVSRLIAIRAGIMRCDEKGAPTGRAWWDTIRYALKEGLIREETARAAGLNKDPGLRAVSIDDFPGSVGLDSDGCIKIVECDKDGHKKLAWLSDCALCIHTETSAKDSTEFMFKGVGAKDHRQVSFTLPAVALSDPRKFKAALINAFGAKNRVGKLDFEAVQRLTRSTRLFKRVEVPAWDRNTPLVPGVGLASDVEYRLGSYTPAEVRAGDIENAKDRLRTLMKTHEYAPILIAVVLGAPAFARWRPNDRFGLGLWGESGSFKTTIAQLALAAFGEGYADDTALLKHGNAGTTTVGATTIFALAGMMPQILDDVKTTNPKDSQSYVSLIHVVIEGKDKARGNKDGTLRDSKEFNCTPIITGEIRPEEASTTARVLNLIWSKTACNKDALNDVEAHISDLPTIGYHWLRFLAGSELNLDDGFSNSRGKKYQEFASKRYVNPGRLATIYTLVRSAWGLLQASPLGEVFEEFSAPFVESLDRVIEVQGQAVTGETELEKFMSGLREIIASRPGIIQSLPGTTTILGSIIGKWTEKGLFLLPTETLNELNKIQAFTQQPTVSSMTAALNATGYLITEEGHLKARVSLNGSQVRGWLIGPKSGIARPLTGLHKNDNSGPDQTDKTAKTGGDKLENFSENFQKNHDRSVDENSVHNSSGLSGLNGLVDEIDREIDIDFDGTNDKTGDKTDTKESGLNSECGKGVTTPAEKARLWDSIRRKMKKYARVDGKRRGIAAPDLLADEIELVQDAGWHRETTGTGISIFWIPEKASAAMGLEAET